MTKRMTIELLRKTIQNLNNYYTYQKNISIILDAYKPDHRPTLVKITIKHILNPCYTRETNYVSTKEAYHYVVGIMNYLDTEEYIQKHKKED